MGLTNRIVPEETAPNGDPALLAQCDAVAEIEDKADEHGITFIDGVTAFQRYLGQPPQSPRSGMSGEVIFNNVGCAQCHTPSFTTSNDTSLEAAIRGKTIRIYSDFLLHDMGATADGIPDGEASGSEMKTPPLWNLRTRPFLIHSHETSVPSNLSLAWFYALQNWIEVKVWWLDVKKYWTHLQLSVWEIILLENTMTDCTTVSIRY